MDPPWQLASSAPSRGVSIPQDLLTTGGDWLQTVAQQRHYGLASSETSEEWLLVHLGHQRSLRLCVGNVWEVGIHVCSLCHLLTLSLVDDITWVKNTVNRRLAKGHGFYLQHAKETCLVGKKGVDPPGLRTNIGSDVLFGERRGQSQKPEELYELIETLVPNGFNCVLIFSPPGKYLEIFARRNNLRNYWVSVGIEL